MSTKRMTPPELGDLVRFKTSGEVLRVREVSGTHFCLTGDHANYPINYSLAFDGQFIENLTKGDNPDITILADEDEVLNTWPIISRPGDFIRFTGSNRDIKDGEIYLRTTTGTFISMGSHAGFAKDSVAYTASQTLPCVVVYPRFDSDDVRLAKHEQDLKDAAGELLVPTPEPGSLAAKLLRANRLLMAETHELRQARDILQECYEEIRECYADEQTEVAKLEAERDEARAERDQARAIAEQLNDEKHDGLGYFEPVPWDANDNGADERDEARPERDEARPERDEARPERDEARADTLQRYAAIPLGGTGGFTLRPSSTGKWVKANDAYELTLSNAAIRDGAAATQAMLDGAREVLALVTRELKEARAEVESLHKRLFKAQRLLGAELAAKTRRAKDIRAAATCPECGSEDSYNPTSRSESELDDADELAAYAVKRLTKERDEARRERDEAWASWQKAKAVIAEVIAERDMFRAQRDHAQKECARARQEDAG